MRSRLEVLVCVCAGFATLLDSSVLGVAVSALRAALRADAVEVQWILASYSLTFGRALVPAGRLGDVLGRRRLFLAGIAVFAGSAVCAALANGPWPVVAARLCQGAGGGFSSQVLGVVGRAGRAVVCVVGHAGGVLVVGASAAAGVATAQRFRRLVRRRCRAGG